MKKNLFFASLFIVGAATVGFAQLNADNNAAGSINLQDTIPAKDTTKPAQDTTKPQTDSAAFTF